MKRILSVICTSIWLPIAVGCANVEPKLDYMDAEKHIATATGVTETYDPATDDGVIAERVVSAMADGLTAEDAVQVCLLNNPNLRAAFLDIGIARADVVQAGLLANPFLGISARFPDGGGLANLEAALSQNITALWQIPVRKKAAKRELDRAVLRIARQAAVLAADCKAAYYDSVGEGQRLGIAEENLEIANNLLEMALARQQAGVATALDVNLSRSLAIDAEFAVESARLAASDARRRLVTLLGLESNEEGLHLVDPLPHPPSNLPKDDVLVAAAKAWRLDLRSARQALLGAKWRLEEQHRMVFPVVEVGVELEREERRPRSRQDLLSDTVRASLADGTLTAPEIEPRSARRDRGQDTIIGPSLGLELPIFDQNQAQIAKARFAYEQMRKTLDSMERAVTQEVRGAADRAVTAWRVASMYRDRSVPLAESNLELSRQAYEAGQTSFLSVLEAERFFLESRRGYIEAARQAATAIPDLERVIGLPFETLTGEIPAGPADEPETSSSEATP